MLLVTSMLQDIAYRCFKFNLIEFISEHLLSKLSIMLQRSKGNLVCFKYMTWDRRKSVQFNKPKEEYEGGLDYS